MSLHVDKVFVVHVKGAHERNKHIQQELGRHGLAFEFMLDGDMSDITPQRLDTYFTGDTLKKVSPQSSCTLKHLLIYEEIVKNNLRGCLVLEDDIFLFPSFVPLFNQSMQELKQAGHRGVIISCEDSTLQTIPRAERVAGQLLYERKHGRCAGAYYIDYAAAKTICDHVAQQKCDRVVDWLHNELAKQNQLSIFWMHPPIASQGSHNGNFASFLDTRGNSLGRRIGWKMKKLWKQHIRAYLK